MLGRKINFFEKLLLPVGLGLTFLGLYLIILAHNADTELSWIRLTAIFTWMVLLFVVIVAATTEDMKEELALLQKEHVMEVKILREISQDQLEEMKLLRQDMKLKR